METQLPTQVQKLKVKTDALVEEAKKAGKTDKKKAKEEVKEEVDVKTEATPLAKEPEHREPVAKEPAAKDDEETWKHKYVAEKHRYEVLQGRYNAEIKPLQDDVNTLNTQKSHIKHLNKRVQEGEKNIRELQTKLKDKEGVSTPEPKKTAIPESILSLVSDEDREFLEEEGIGNKSVEIIGKLVQELSTRNQPDNSQHLDIDELREEARQSKENREVDFWDKVNVAVSDWKELNISDSFNDWLEAFIPYANVTRREAIKTAQKNLDHNTVISLFNDFKKEQPAQEPKPAPLAVNLEEHIEPEGTVGSEEPKDKPKGKTYSRADIVKFYDDWRRGNLTDEKEIAWIDADIVKAQSEGRITN